MTHHIVPVSERGTNVPDNLQHGTPLGGRTVVSKSRKVAVFAAYSPLRFGEPERKRRDADEWCVLASEPLPPAVVQAQRLSRNALSCRTSGRFGLLCHRAKPASLTAYVAGGGRPSLPLLQRIPPVPAPRATRSAPLGNRASPTDLRSQGCGRVGLHRSRREPRTTLRPTADDAREAFSAGGRALAAGAHVERDREPPRGPV